MLGSRLKPWCRLCRSEECCISRLKDLLTDERISAEGTGLAIAFAIKLRA